MTIYEHSLRIGSGQSSRENKVNDKTTGRAMTCRGYQIRYSFKDSTFEHSVDKVRMFSHTVRGPIF